MPPKVDPLKCDACQGESEPLCEQVCPGNLMTLDLGEPRKAYCRDAGDCWDCMSCTKACPRQAIQTTIQYQLAYFPGKLIPLVGTNSVTWTSIDCNGMVERFVIRTIIGSEDDDEE